MIERIIKKKVGKPKYTEEKIALLNADSYLFTCNKCGISKPNTEYSKECVKSKVRKFKAKCKECYRASNLTYYYSNIEISRIRVSDYYRNNTEKCIESTNRAKKVRGINPLYNLYWSARGSSYRRDWEFDITLDYMQEVYNSQKGLCFYTGDEMLFKSGKDLDNISIDRRDSTKGYIRNNIVFCKYQVNIMKSNSSLDYLFEFCEKILNNKENILKNE